MRPGWHEHSHLQGSLESIFIWAYCCPKWNQGPLRNNKRMETKQGTSSGCHIIKDIAGFCSSFTSQKPLTQTSYCLLTTGDFFLQEIVPSSWSFTLKPTRYDWLILLCSPKRIDHTLENFTLVIITKSIWKKTSRVTGLSASSERINKPSSIALLVECFPADSTVRNVSVLFYKKWGRSPKANRVKGVETEE